MTVDQAAELMWLARIAVMLLAVRVGVAIRQ